MNIKSLLLGSAAALAVVSGAQAADAVVAAEPEPMEYVKVCDAYGTGYFYIPGTETCLKIGGQLRTQINYHSDVKPTEWSNFTRGQITFDAKNDSEFGVVGSTITYNILNNGSAGLDAAYIDFAGFRVGYFYNYWDDGLSGEVDNLGSNSNSTVTEGIRYTYDAGSFQIGASVESMNALYAYGQLGYSAKASATFGAVTADVIGSYDSEREQGTVQGRVIAEVGPGKFEGAVTYETGYGFYSNGYEWTVSADYVFKATDKLTFTPAAQYEWSPHKSIFNPAKGGGDNWQVGLLSAYELAPGLAISNSIVYDDNSEDVSGYLRLQRTF